MVHKSLVYNILYAARARCKGAVSSSLLRALCHHTEAASATPARFVPLKFTSGLRVLPLGGGGPSFGITLRCGPGAHQRPIDREVLGREQPGLAGPIKHALEKLPHHHVLDQPLEAYIAAKVRSISPSAAFTISRIGRRGCVWGTKSSGVTSLNSRSCVTSAPRISTTVSSPL